MGIDEAGVDVETVRVEDFRVRRGGQIGADAGNFAAHQQDIGDIRPAVDRVMDKAVFYECSRHRVYLLVFVGAHSICARQAATTRGRI